MYTYECETCGRQFGSEHAIQQHMYAKNHWLWGCHYCYETFPTEEDWRDHEYYNHHYCSDCDREFRDGNSLEMHLNSSRRRGGNVPCPFCNKVFGTATGLAHHLEMGACPNADTSRDQMYGFWKGLSAYEVTERSWNGVGYECYLCRRVFGSLHGLSQHLNSPAHQEAIYHCPNPNCRDFTSLAAIINHLESEACGFTRFEVV
ncbi:hypothetical protein NLG97_g10698 [Lecanicillium saksenae]|uniref:Uncharacterized protein n=1 Tax=Lecanicillium saksenae TaxID=468837 RepID=A0ACC1QFN3_9HYPO|nr:hypothetical protein NLG97_g10698 [Lecanicillium saksenae]